MRFFALLLIYIGFVAFTTGFIYQAFPTINKYKYLKEASNITVLGAITFFIGIALWELL